MFGKVVSKKTIAATTVLLLYSFFTAYSSPIVAPIEGSTPSKNVLYIFRVYLNDTEIDTIEIRFTALYGVFIGENDPKEIFLGDLLVQQTKQMC